MGLFNQLAKGITKAVGETVGNAIGDDIANTITGKLNEALDVVNEKLPEDMKIDKVPADFAQKTGTVQSSAASGSTQKAVQTGGAGMQDEKNPGDYGVSERPLYARLEQILRTEFPNLQVRTNVPATELGGKEWYRDITFGVYEAGRPVGFIMVIPHNKDTNNAFRGTDRVCFKSTGNKLIRFYEQFENKEEYVTDRLHELLKR